ncbi:AHH domain-containing protein [Bacterioplanoides pacificum]|uniref:AHH domain-containing protein n=1 Tax=Bacterioplanoides pacificum TaxID=1171596 RepID=A0ABV7VPE5_9GAMM
MDYQVKHRTEISWYELDRIELPSAAEALINRPIQLSYRVRQQLGSLRESNALNSAENASRQKKLLQHLRRGEFFLLAPVGRVKQPALLRQAEVNADSASIELDCQISLVIISEQLRSALMHLLRTVERPKMVASVSRADNRNNSSDQSQGNSNNPRYWFELECTFENDPNASVDGLPYEITFSDGSKKQGKLWGSLLRLSNVPAGSISVQLGYPESEKLLQAARKELQQALDDIINALKQRASRLDEALANESIAMQGLILTGAFFDGLFGALGDSAEGIAQLAEDLVADARVKMDEWEGIAEDVKQQTIEYVSNKKAVYLEFLAEVDEKRANAEQALQKSMDQFKKDLEELASYGAKRLDNAYAYGVESLQELQEVYNHYRLLFEDSETGQMLKEFPDRYYEAMPKVEAAQSGGGLGFNVLTAALTGGAGAGVVVAGFIAKNIGLFRKVKKIIDRVLDLLSKKKLTPEKEVKSQHNQTAQAKVEKDKEEAVEEKEKKTCQFNFDKRTKNICGKPYNNKCPLCNSHAQKRATTRKGGPNKGISSILSDRIMSNLQSNNKAKENNEVLDSSGNLLYKKDSTKKKNHKSYHPWFQGDDTLAAHHIIASEAVKGKQWQDYFNMCGYDINCKENGIMLPSRPEIACQLGVPLHYGNHDEGEAVIKDQETRRETITNYTKGVKILIEEVEIAIKKNKYCSTPERIKNAFNEKSNEILEYLEKFYWTLTSDGRDYKLAKGSFGCGNHSRKELGSNKDCACSLNRKHNYVFSQKNTSLKAGE